MYVVPSESAVEDLVEVLNQRLETIDAYLNPGGRIQMVSPFLNSDPEGSTRGHSLQLWRVYQACDYELRQESPDPKTQPLPDVDHVFLRAERDDDDRLVGYFAATRCSVEGNLLENWCKQG